MAKDAQSPTAPTVAAQHFQPPSGRQLRAQAVHRLQVGLFGLATMLLLVGLANIIMERARQSDADSGIPVRAEASPSTARDPLADIGVVPAADPSASATDEEPR